VILLFDCASGGWRRSEITMANWQDMRRLAATDFVYRLEHSKTRQAGRTDRGFNAGQARPGARRRCPVCAAGFRQDYRRPLFVAFGVIASARP
jgi:hypothetical protein